MANSANTPAVSSVRLSFTHACLSEGAASLQGDLLNDLQRHHWMDFPYRIAFRLASPV